MGGKELEAPSLMPTVKVVQFHRHCHVLSVTPYGATSAV